VRFSDVLHQDGAQDRLQRALRCGRVPHAYLFAGPEGVGKEMLAQRFAAVLLCPHAVEQPAADLRNRGIAATGIGLEACGTCDDCVLFAAGTHPDLHRIHRGLSRYHPDPAVRARKATVLGIDVIRHFLIERAGLFPSRGQAKVFLIPEAHLLSDESQNALLKTLEEPPDHTFLILLAASVETMLPTTRSRCHLVRFSPLPTSFVEQALQKQHGAPPAAARFLAELSQGSLGLALRGWRAGLHESAAAVWEALGDAARDPLGAGKALLAAAEAVAHAYHRGPAAPSEEAEDDEPAEKETGVIGATAEEDRTAAASPPRAGGVLNPLREAQKTVLSMVAIALRDVLRLGVGAPPAAVPADKRITALARVAAPAAVGQAIRAVSQAEMQIERSLNAQLVFDNVGIALGQALTPTTGRR